MNNWLDRLLSGTGITHSENFLNATRGYFTWGHCLLIGMAFIILCAFAVLFFRRKNWETRVFIVCSVLGAVIFFSLIGYAVATGEYMLEWFIPLHICSFMVVLMPIATIFRGKVRHFCYDYFVIAGIIGAVMAIVFPMTAIPYYPPFHIVTLLTWGLHIVIGALSVYLVASGCYRRYNWLNLVTVIYVLVIPALLVNSFFGTNFLFLNKARATFPTSLVYDVFGNYTLFFMLGAITAVAFLGHLFCRWFDKIKKKTLINVLRYVRQHLDLDEQRIQNFLKNSWLLKRFKNKDSCINRAYTCIFTKDVIEFLKQSTIEQLLDYDHMVNNLRELGVFERFHCEFGIFKTLRLQKAARAPRKIGV